MTPSLTYRKVASMDTRDKILNSAQRLIQTRSFHGFSFQDIADEVGIRKASLYHYFASKDDVALAVLEGATNWVSAQMEKIEGQEPIERLEAYLDMFRVIHGKGERMCPGGSFGAVFGAVSSPLQTALHRFAQDAFRSARRALSATEWSAASLRSASSAPATSPSRSRLTSRALS